MNNREIDQGKQNKTVARWNHFYVNAIGIVLHLVCTHQQNKRNIRSVTWDSQNLAFSLEKFLCSLEWVDLLFFWSWRRSGTAYSIISKPAEFQNNFSFCPWNQPSTRLTWQFSKLVIQFFSKLRVLDPITYLILLYKLECFIEISTTEKNRICYT